LIKDEYIIKARGLVKNFGAVEALKEVDFELKKGEILGLVGDNGAGKSTLIKILSGAITPDAGKIEVFGKEVKIKTPQDAFNLGIETIYQDLALFNNLDFVQNIFAGREYIGKGIKRIFRVADDKRMRIEAKNRIKDISINLPDLNQKTENLSGGQRQAVAITRAIFWGRKILIMDEPTAALGVKESKKVLELIDSVKINLEGIIIITHNIEHMIRIADRIIILRNGMRQGLLECNEYENKHDLHNDIVKLITGAELVI